MDDTVTNALAEVFEPVVAKRYASRICARTVRPERAYELAGRIVDAAATGTVDIELLLYEAYGSSPLDSCLYEQEKKKLKNCPLKSASPSSKRVLWSASAAVAIKHTITNCKRALPTKAWLHFIRVPDAENAGNDKILRARVKFKKKNTHIIGLILTKTLVLESKFYLHLVAK